MSKLIDLAGYAAKYGVSQSTLRRRIKAKTIPFVLERGKYFLEDSPSILEKAPLFSRNYTGHSAEEINRSPHLAKHSHTHAGVVNPRVENVDPAKRNQEELRMAASFHQGIDEEKEKLLAENRKLKAQIAELETFINALEAELSERNNKSEESNGSL